MFAHVFEAQFQLGAHGEVGRGDGAGQVGAHGRVVTHLFLRLGGLGVEGGGGTDGGHEEAEGSAEGEAHDAGHGCLSST